MNTTSAHVFGYLTRDQFIAAKARIKDMTNNFNETQALEKAKLDIAAHVKANEALEAENEFLRKEISYCAERLAKLAEKKVTQERNAE